jgi:O6-methylguanine-DNA--protein-cysteine methyltransferase
MLTVPYGANVTTQEFSSELACNDAAMFIKQANSKNTKSKIEGIACFPKGK